VILCTLNLLNLHHSVNVNWQVLSSIYIYIYIYILDRTCQFHWQTFSVMYWNVFLLQMDLSVLKSDQCFSFIFLDHSSWPFNGGCGARPEIAILLGSIPFIEYYSNPARCWTSSIFVVTHLCVEVHFYMYVSAYMSVSGPVHVHLYVFVVFFENDELLLLQRHIYANYGFIEIIGFRILLLLLLLILRILLNSYRWNFNLKWRICIVLHTEI